MTVDGIVTRRDDGACSPRSRSGGQSGIAVAQGAALSEKLTCFAPSLK